MPVVTTALEAAALGVSNLLPRSGGHDDDVETDTDGSGKDYTLKV